MEAALELFMIGAVQTVEEVCIPFLGREDIQGWEGEECVGSGTRRMSKSPQA